MIRKSHICFLIVAVAIALLFRIAYLTEIYDDPVFRHPEIDALYHNYWGKGLVTGNWIPPLDHDYPAIQENAFFKPPGTPYLLASVYYIFGINNLYPKILFLFLGIFSCVLMYFFVRRLFDELTGKIATLFFAVYWAFIYYEATFLEPTFTVFLIILCFFLLFKWLCSGGLWKFLLSAIVAGICALTRPNMLLCVPVIGLLFVFWGWKEKKNLLRGIAIGFAWCFIVGATILPATIRNYLVSGELVPINSQAGITLYTGNNPHANGYIATTPEIGGWTCFDWPRIVDETNQRIGKNMSQAETDKFYSRKALDYIKSHPYRTLQLMTKKFLLFWGPKEVCNQKEAECDIKESTVLRLLPVRFSHILALAFLGLIMWMSSVWKNRNNNLNDLSTSKPTQFTIYLIIAFTFVYSLTFIPFQVAGRYRVPIIPFLIIGASYAISFSYKLLVKKKFKTLLLWAVAAISLWLITSHNFAGYKPRVGRWYLSRGAAYLLDGKYDKALKNLEKAKKIRPNDERIYANIGVVLLSTGDVTQAKLHFEKAIDINTNYYRALKNLGLLYAQQQNFNPALKYLKQAYDIRPDYFLARELGAIYGSQKNITNALKYLKLAVKLRQTDAKSHCYLGMLYADLNQFDNAYYFYKNALNLKLNSFNVNFALAKISIKRDDTSNAFSYLKSALALDPANVKARYLLARIYEKQKLWQKACDIYNSLINENIDYPPLMNNYAWILATSNDNSIRDGKKALALAKQVCINTSYNEFSFVDTLAAAYAEVGDYSNAITIIEKYQYLATNSQMKELIKNRLDMYRKKNPIRTLK